MTTLFTVTRSPFLPWKSAAATWREAQRRGMSVFVALDERSSVQDAERVAELVGDMRTFRGECCEDAFGLVSEIEDDWVLRIDDDEEPSDLCWRLALEPPFPAVFGIPVIPYLGRKMWRRDMGFQDRLFPSKDWRWEGGFNGKAVHPYKTMHIGVNPGVMIWHHSIAAPRAEREEKAERYARLDPASDHRSRLMYEDHPEDMVDMPEHIALHLPKKKARIN